MTKAARKPAGPDRRPATQARSRATVARILDAAMALTIEKGADAVTMSEIAQRAEVVIGALYRYFSDRAAINRAILQRHYDEVDAMLVERLSGVTTVPDLVARVQAIYETYFEMHQKDPAFKAIWSIVQTDAELQALDIEDTLKNTKFVASVMKPLFPKADNGRLTATCTFILHFSASTARLAPALPRPIGKHMKPVYQQVIADALKGLARGD